MRRRYIDWARAFAILVMIEAHTLDAWTRLSARGTPAFKNLTILGGFAAPLFLWLAGIAVVLSAQRTLERTGSRREAAAAVCRRGLEIFVLAFLFRIQAFVVSPGSPLVMLFRVDILNIMGPAIVAAGVLWGVCRGGTSVRASAFGAAAVGIAMVTPLVRTAAWVEALPVWVQWYVRPAGEYTTFTLFPWVAFVFAGGSVGALLTSVRGGRGAHRLHVALAAVGAALVVAGFTTALLPPLYPKVTFWNTSPTFFAIRVGVLMLVLSALYAVEQWLTARESALPRLERFGRSSLFIYWIHVEFVYGYATWPLRRHLLLWQLGVGYVAFVAALYGALVLRDRVVAGWQSNRSAASPATPAAA